MDSDRQGCTKTRTRAYVLGILGLGYAVQFIITTAFGAAVDIERLMTGIGDEAKAVGIDRTSLIAIGIVLVLGLIA